ncbi:hypothetical protein AB0L82_23090 [Nocardia sp. NPDC052001]|uniref:hypothetical protein n=1 Tax=Nocardia sp. NPDC052001 TaxID=3154853 RepID=UPI003432BFC3
MQFKYGQVRQYRYEIGDELIWAAAGIGDATAETAVVEGYACECPNCEFELGECEVLIACGRLIGVRPLTGRWDFRGDEYVENVDIDHEPRPEVQLARKAMRTWAKPADVPPGSGVAEQLSLMKSLACRQITCPTFARSWYDARRRSLDNGERVREPFERLLTRVFYDLADYPIDHSLRESGDITDEGLIDNVRDVLKELARL